MNKVCAGCGTIIEFGTTPDEKIEWVDADQHCKLFVSLTKKAMSKSEITRSLMTLTDDYLAGRVQWREFEIYSKALLMKAKNETVTKSAPKTATFDS